MRITADTGGTPTALTPAQTNVQVLLEAAKAAAASGNGARARQLLAQASTINATSTATNTTAVQKSIADTQAVIDTTVPAINEAVTGLTAAETSVDTAMQNPDVRDALGLPPIPVAQPTDAYALLIQTFKLYGLEELVPEIMTMMENGMGAAQAGLAIRQTKAYLTRFDGNTQRRNAGLNVLDESAYLDMENSYSQTMQAYGLAGYFGTDAKSRQAKMAGLIGNDISAVEFKDRIDTVVTRVQNSDPNIKATLKSFYNIGDADLIGYFLNPKEGLPRLQEKVTAAEIGSEFIKQGLTSGVTSAEEFAKLGITKATAAKGAETIAGLLPETKKLSGIYGEENINYTQRTAEEEVMMGLDSARRKRELLAKKEVGSWSGSSGTYRSNTSTAGQL